MPDNLEEKVTGLSVEEAVALLEIFDKGQNWHTAEQVRDRVFSTLKVGAPLYKPYWFSADTHYNDNIWTQNLADGHGGYYTRTIDFNIRLTNGLLLTHKKNKKLLGCIKHLLAIQVHPRFNSTFFKPSYAQSMITRALYIADWLLLNLERFSILQYDLGLINQNDYTYILGRITDLPISEAVYNLNFKAEYYIRRQINLIDEDDFQKALIASPRIAQLIPKHNRRLNLTDDELVRAHYVFLKRGWYKSSRGALILSTSKLLQEIYRETLHGMNQRPSQGRFDELDIGQEYYTCEFEAVEVVLGYNEGVDLKLVGSYLQTLRKIAIYESEPKFHIDKKAILSQSIRRVLAGRTRKPDGRYQTAPMEVVGKMLRFSLEFVIENADNILTEMLRALKQHKDDNKSKTGIPGNYTPSGMVLAGGLRPTRWSIYRDSSNFYLDLRKGTGLSELYHILMGSASVAICTLTARRRTEICKLDSMTCLQPYTDPSAYENRETNYSLRFGDEKTGAGEHTEEIERPIPRVIAQFIYKVKRFNEELLAMGLIPENHVLFQTVNRADGRVSNVSSNGLYDFLDLTFDFFEAPTVRGKDGIERRYYLRPHQLRRFFAMVFFNSSSDHKIHAIAWMLGHTNLTSFWRYVTEVVGGRALIEAKANTLTHAITDESSPIQNLNGLIEQLKKDYATKQVHIKTSEELNDDLHYLSTAGLIELEPTFEEYLKGEHIEHDILMYLKQGTVEFEPSFFNVKDNDDTVIHKFVLVLKVRDQEEE